MIQVKTELGLTIATSAPKATPEQVTRLISELRRAKRSLLAAELAQLMFGKTTETAKRRVRVVAKAARPRVVSFPGSDGYDLWARCNINQLWTCVYQLETHGKELINEAHVFRKALHSGFRGEPGDDGQAELLDEGACQGSP